MPTRVFSHSCGAAADADSAHRFSPYPFHRPAKARVLGAATMCGAVAAAARSAFLPAGVLAVLSVVLVGTQLGVIKEQGTKPDQVESGAAA